MVLSKSRLYIQSLQRFASCVATQQNATFWGLRTPAGGYDPQIWTRQRLLYIAPTSQVSSSCVYLFGVHHVDKQAHKQIHKQTNRCCRKHPTFFAMLRRWVNVGSGKVALLWGIILALALMKVLIAARELLCWNLRQVSHAMLYLSPSSVIWYQPKLKGKHIYQMTHMVTCRLSWAGVCLRVTGSEIIATWWVFIWGRAFTVSLPKCRIFYFLCSECVIGALLSDAENIEWWIILISEIRSCLITTAASCDSRCSTEICLWLRHRFHSWPGEIW